MWNNVFVYRCLSVAVWFILLLHVLCDFYPYLTLFVIVHIIYKLYLKKRYKKVLPVDKKAVLISGCDTGFGHHLANRLADHGFIVFAGVLNIDGKGAQTLKRKRHHNLHLLPLDVSKDEDVVEAVKVVTTKTKNKGLWAIVNNAGINFRGDLELCLMDYYWRCHEVNLYGTLRLVKAFLPQIRKHQGRIVNVSSARGRYSLPGDTVYQSSKFGLETLSDSLRMEMVKFGVNVSVVEPARYDASTSCSSPEMCQRLKNLCEEMWQTATPEVRETYGQDYFYRPYELMEKTGTAGTSLTPDPVLNAIEDALLNTEPRPRYLVDSATGLVDRSAMFARILPFVPEYISDAILKWFTGCHLFPSRTKEE